MRGFIGTPVLLVLVPVLFGLAGVAVLLAGCVGVEGALVLVPVPELPFPEAGVAAGVAEGGSEVSGVGSGGKGLVSMLATSSFIPASDLS